MVCPWGARLLTGASGALCFHPIRVDVEELLHRGTKMGQGAETSIWKIFLNSADRRGSWDGFNPREQRVSAGTPGDTKYPVTHVSPEVEGPDWTDGNSFGLNFSFIRLRGGATYPCT